MFKQDVPARYSIKEGASIEKDQERILLGTAREQEKSERADRERGNSRHGTYQRKFRESGHGRSCVQRASKRTMSFD